MTLLKKVLSGILISSSTFISAQKMHFGNGGGLNITTTGTSLLPGSPINTKEGCAEIVDELTGQIILYTDGKSIWNSNHVLQPNLLNQNWNASQLSNLQSSTHAALIAPIPQKNNTEFFIFTTTSGNAITSVGSGSGYGPLRVSHVKLVSGSFVVSTADNNYQLTDAGIIVGEKIALTSDGNCGYWVVTSGVGTYGNNNDREAPLYIAPPATSPAVKTSSMGKFYAYHITASTTSPALLKATQVTSTFSEGGHKSWGHSYSYNTETGSHTVNMVPSEYTISRGQMKFNQTGTRLACALTNQQEFQVYEFNKTTGVVFNQERLYGGSIFGGYGQDPGGCYAEALPYGIEFSPNDQFIYVSTLGDVTRQGIYQFDRTNGYSRKVLEWLENGPTPYYGGMQKGIDGRIYVATYPHVTIGCITDPNNPWGTSNSLPNSTTMGYPTAIMSPIPISGGCKLTLPTVVNGSPNPVLSGVITAATPICSGNPIIASATWSGNIPVQYHCWILEECDQYGNYNGGYASPFYWQVGPPSTFQFPNTTNIPCNTYYRVKLALQNLNYCIPWIETTKIIRYNCSPNATADATPDTVCIGGCVTLSNIATQPANTAVSYAWYTNSGGTNVLAGTGSPLTLCNITAQTTYILKAYTKPGCLKEDDITVYVKTCSAPGKFASSNTDDINITKGNLTVYPNPSTGLLSLKLENAQDKSYALEVFDVYGKLVYKNDLANTQGTEFTTEVNLSGLNLSNGLYMINLSSDNQVLSQRIMIQK